VCLVSGYLFPSQRVLRVPALRALVRTLRERGCTVATTDPYLGTYRGVAQARPAASSRVAALLGRMRLRLHVRRVARVLEGLPQVYPVPMDAAPAGQGARASFFNPRYLRTPAQLEALARAASALDPSASGKPQWLFVLARFDLEFQERRYGLEGFADRVAAKLREALAQGRHPTFIGPASIVAQLERRIAPDCGVGLRTHCPFEEFEQRLLGAECVFHWQYFPTSAFLRLWNGLPVFSFDPGHNARLLAPLCAAGLERYYLGDPPVLLDIDRPLDAAGLAGQRAAFRRSAHACRARLESLPSPGEMIAALRAAG
jgi:hypothetical protein